MWIIAAGLSAFFAGITAILAKCGVKRTDSDLATALRTAIVLGFSWVMVLLVGSQHTITELTSEQLIPLILSGLSTGASWICYFRALSLGDVGRVVPIDKSSTILTILLAMLFFGETSHLTLRLVGTTVLSAGILLMAQIRTPKSRTQEVPHSNPSIKTPVAPDSQGSKKAESAWWIYAILSAVFASLTSILAKLGMTGVESNLGTAIRTGVVLLMAWGIVFVRGKAPQIKAIDKKELLFLLLSGIATGASWLCYYYAIQNGEVSVVVPIDKLSILVTILFSRIVLRERLSRRALCGLVLMVIGTLVLVIT